MTLFTLNDASSPLALLQSRRSVKARTLSAPGPDAAELERILAIASRVPDHGKLAPWRFVVIEDRHAFTALLQRLWRQHRPDAARTDLEALDQFAHQAPVLVTLVSRPEKGHIPVFEQRLSAGAAGLNLLLAAHAMGYAGCWLTGARAELPGLVEALGVPGGRIAGFFFLGTPTTPATERPRPTPGQVVLRWNGAAQ